MGLSLLDGTSGRLLHSIVFERGVFVATTIVDPRTGRVFVLTSTASNGNGYAMGAGTLRVFDGTSGRLVRRLALGPQVSYGASLVDPQSGQVFLLTSPTVDEFGSLTGPSTLRVFDGGTGAPRHTVPAGLSAGPMVLDAGRRRLFILEPGQVDSQGYVVGNDIIRVLDIRTGALVRIIPGRAVGQSGALALDTRTQRLFVDASPGLRMLDERTGAVQATVPFTLPGLYANLVSDVGAGRVVADLEDDTENYLMSWILDARTGAVLHRVMGGCGGARVLDVTAGQVVCLLRVKYSPSTPDYISVITLDTRSGHVAQAAVTQGIDTLADGAVDERHNLTLVLPWYGDAAPHSPLGVVVYATQTQHEREDLTLGSGPGAVAVEEQTGRVFVANGGDKTISVLDAARL